MTDTKTRIDNIRREMMVLPGLSSLSGAHEIARSFERRALQVGPENELGMRGYTDGAGIKAKAENARVDAEIMRTEILCSPKSDDALEFDARFDSIRNWYAGTRKQTAYQVAAFESELDKAARMFDMDAEREDDGDRIMRAAREASR